MHVNVIEGRACMNFACARVCVRVHARVCPCVRTRACVRTCLSGNSACPVCNTNSGDGPGSDVFKHIIEFVPKYARKCITKRSMLEMYPETYY